jgi:hypothetical protein
MKGALLHSRATASSNLTQILHKDFSQRGMQDIYRVQLYSVSLFQQENKFHRDSLHLQEICVIPTFFARDKIHYFPA